MISKSSEEAAASTVAGEGGLPPGLLNSWATADSFAAADACIFQNKPA